MAAGVESSLYFILANLGIIPCVANEASKFFIINNLWQNLLRQGLDSNLDVTPAANLHCLKG
jgi:hypothetical protein